MSVPGADELFRPTVVPAPTGPEALQPDPPELETGDDPAPVRLASRAPSGRVRHDEKMTVYVTADELLDLEHARLTLRRAGLSVDRGRLVREAIAMALADLDANGEASELVHRLTEA